MSVSEATKEQPTNPKFAGDQKSHDSETASNIHTHTHTPDTQDVPSSPTRPQQPHPRLPFAKCITILSLPFWIRYSSRALPFSFSSPT